MAPKPLKTNFFKLYFAAAQFTPKGQIYVYYNSRPLYSPAVFDEDRYYFSLPKNLEEKLIAGELIADFSYTELPFAMGTSKHMKTPCSIILSDRYE
jgi:hypothetical protein